MELGLAEMVTARSSRPVDPAQYACSEDSTARLANAFEARAILTPSLKSDSPSRRSTITSPTWMPRKLDALFRHEIRIADPSSHVGRQSPRAPRRRRLQLDQNAISGVFTTRPRLAILPDDQLGPQRAERASVPPHRAVSRRISATSAAKIVVSLRCVWLAAIVHGLDRRRRGMLR